MIGETLNRRYRLLSLLGTGRCGQTYLAEDIQAKGDPRCVIKQFEPQAKDDLSLRKAKYLFAREVKILKILGKSDRIPNLLDYFQESEKFYLVHEFIDGTDLAQELKSGQQWTEAQVVALLREILEIVDLAHREQVIHQDIKPSNIIRRKSDGRLILIDFGSVKKIYNQMANADGNTSLTVPIGTDGYMAPEQRSIRPRLASDVYAVGMIGIYALTGIEPKNIPQDHQTEKVQWRDLVQVDEKLAQVLERMVSPEFNQRYTSASEAFKTFKKFKLGSKLLDFKTIIGASVLLLAVLGAGYYYWRLENSLNQTSTTDSYAQDQTQVPFLYRNITHGIEMKYPFSWELNQSSQDWGTIAIFIPQKSQSYLVVPEVTIKVEKSPQFNSLDEYTTNAVYQITQLPKVKIIDSRPIEINEKQAHQVIYTASNLDNNLELKYLQIWTINSDRVYTVTYQADVEQYDNFAETVENEMFKSLNITPAK